MAIGTKDMYVYRFFVEDTVSDGIAKPTLYSKIRVISPVLSSNPDLTDGFSCKRALRSVNPNLNRIYLSGYPSGKIIQIDLDGF